jgi:Flp pilus assembly protein TadB
MSDDLVTLLGVVTGIGMVGGITAAAFYFAARAKRRRREGAAPDALDLVDAVVSEGAELAPLEVQRRYRNDADRR